VGAGSSKTELLDNTRHIVFKDGSTLTPEYHDKLIFHSPNNQWPEDLDYAIMKDGSKVTNGCYEFLRNSEGYEEAWKEASYFVMTSKSQYTVEEYQNHMAICSVVSEELKKSEFGNNTQSERRLHANMF
jgi:hypothetical protein